MAEERKMSPHFNDFAPEPTPPAELTQAKRAQLESMTLSSEDEGDD